ncbi:hypothetical protein B0A79_22860 [Flavobacterium piscis]|uniref:Uncharacterized protein n=1 Tax=Flavobacterium piscis TaxID=1114874 RepID=A0ABX2XCD1_9FLAO|nr:hypothetical protein FLP_22175 [Flavobacterium piscis]OXE96535.1 hypothetical protein B0A79_22860 [Flavobacterium piscis]
MLSNLYSLLYFLSSICKIKKAESLPPFLPQIYHKLNLLMLWFSKCMAAILMKKTFLMNGKYIRLSKKRIE